MRKGMVRVGGNDRRRKRSKARKGAGEKSSNGGLIDRAVVKALSHPVRVEILGLLCREGEMSPKEISVCLGQPLSVTSYHVKVLLVDCDMIELAKEVPKRGAMEHFYRSKLEASDPRIASFQASINNLLDVTKGVISEGE